MAGEDFLSRLKADAQRLIARNAPTLAELTGKGPAPPLVDRAKRVWDIPAKISAGRQIADEETNLSQALDPSENAHNNVYDALRHARWSYRTSKAAGPVFSTLAGAAHELDDLKDAWDHRSSVLDYNGDDPTAPPDRSFTDALRESAMDWRNNAEGRRAAREGRAIDPRRLQTASGTSHADGLYDKPPQGRTFSGGR